MNFSWNTGAIAKLLHLTSETNAPIAAITTDSRQVGPGCLFIAIKGDSFDGHDFIAQAIDKGAVAIITEKPFQHPTAQVFVVPSTLEAIRKLAHHYRKQFKIPFVGIVGAVGKTTTKELLSSLLAGKYQHVAKTEGSQNGYLGIAITLLSIKPETEIAVIEIGIDEIGAMAQHLALVEPTHTLLTANGPEHLHQLKTVEIAASEELKAFDYALTHRIPLAINLSDEFVRLWFDKNQPKLDVQNYKTYSLRASDQPMLKGAYLPNENLLKTESEAGSESYTLPLPGEHHAHNLLAATTLGLMLGLTTKEMKAGLATFKTAYGRTEIHKLSVAGGEVEIIGDYYNSNPSSAQAALKLLNEKQSKGTHAVLGDMLELGDNEETFHRKLADTILSENVNQLWLFGPRMKWLQDEMKRRSFTACAHFDAHETLIEALKNSIKPGERVLIKGSRGMRMEKVLKGLTA